MGCQHIPGPCLKVHQLRQLHCILRVFLGAVAAPMIKSDGISGIFTTVMVQKRGTLYFLSKRLALRLSLQGSVFLLVEIDLLAEVCGQRLFPNIIRCGYILYRHTHRFVEGDFFIVASSRFCSGSYFTNFGI